MKNRVLLLIYLVSVVITAFAAYNFYLTQKTQANEKVILNFDNKQFILFKKKFPLKKEFGYIWGLKDKKKSLKKKKVNKKKKTNQLQVKQKGSSLCIKKDCYRFLGIFHKEDKAYISLYNKKFKHKIDSFTVGEKLGYTLYIEKIFQNKAVIKDQKSSRRWTFKLFDVDTVKYKPKDINENKN